MEKHFGKNTIEGSPQAGTGREGFEQFLTEFFSTFPDWRANIKHIVAEKNLVVVFLNGIGTHGEEFQGIPSTYKSVNIRSADLHKIEG
jgi:predicted ester cyclase